MKEILEVRNLAKNYPGFSLKNLSFTLEKEPPAGGLEKRQVK